MIVTAIQILKQSLGTLIENTLDGSRISCLLVSLVPLRGQLLQSRGDFFRNGLGRNEMREVRRLMNSDGSAPMLFGPSVGTQSQAGKRQKDLSFRLKNGFGVPLRLVKQLVREFVLVIRCQ